MATQGGGGPLSPPSPSTAFRKLIEACGKKHQTDAPPRFVKKLDSIPEVELPPD